MNPPPTRKSIRQALKNWHSAKRLGEQPLAQLRIVDTCRKQSGYGPTPAGYGVALRAVLQDALDTLKPGPGEPDRLKRRWRAYLLLRLRYVDQRSPAYVLEQLGIARSTFDHEQTRAFDTLGDTLHQWEQTETRATPLGEAAAPVREDVPFLVPPRADYPLVGRTPRLYALRQRLLAGDGPVALNGLPGVGKTALAIELAHDPGLQAHFSDGVLWAGLGRQPNILALLGTWGTALNIPVDDLNKLTTIEARANTIHAAIGTRRMLLVVDDAWQGGDALAFKIGGPNCTHLLTTRLPRVAVDFAGEGAILLPELEDAEGLELLAHFVPNVVMDGPDAARALVQAAGGLPLALTLMGRYLRKESHSQQPRRLHAALTRLQQIEARFQLSQPHSPLKHQPSLPLDIPLSLLTVMAISANALDPASRNALWTLSVLPPKPNTFSEDAALAVSEASVETIDTLSDYGLLESGAPGRYTLHQTTAEYTGLKLDEQPPQRHTARQRMVSFFVEAVETHPPPMLELEIENTLAALHLAHAQNMPAALIRGTNVFCHFLESRGLYPQAETHLQRAEAAARTLDDPEALLATLGNLGRMAQRQGNYQQTQARYQEGFDLALREEIPEQTSAMLQGLGLVAYLRGDFPRAETCYQESLSIARELGDTIRTSALLSNLGALALNRGEFAQAEACFQEGLALAQEAGRTDRVGALLTNLGVIAARRGDHLGAAEYFREGLDIARQMRNRQTMSPLLTNLGALASERGDHTQAEAYFREGLELAREMGQRARISHLLANLGALATWRQAHDQAEACLQEGLELAREMGHRENTILLLTNLGALCLARGDDSQAETYVEEGLGLARETGYRRFIAALLNHQGELLLRRRMWEAASTAFTEALEAAQTLAAQQFIATAQYGLGRVAAARGDTAEAQQRGQESLAIFEQIESPRSEEVRAWMDGLR